MKRVIIGAVVGTVIYFLFQTLMWEGGFHRNFYTYTPNQDTILSTLNKNLTAEGLYVIPMADPLSPTFKEDMKKKEALMPGKPWAMVFYHPVMAGFEAGYLLRGILYVLISCLLASLVIYYGKFDTFGARFLVAMAFSFFALSQGVLNNMNWWSYPWKFIQPEVIDLTIGWAICSVWLAWFVKRKAPGKQEATP
ncbi:MAG TPA: hypothetical protein VMC08_01830 [Bacteroidales bacterium]|nr:hypothetical protein [Bacteroidales bacterium]